MAEKKKVEKKFCTKCGKELKEGEVCNCSENAAITVNTEALGKFFNNMLGIIVNIFKRPSKTVDKEVEEKDVKTGIAFLVLKAIAFGLLIMAGAKLIFEIIGDFAGSDLFSLIEDDIDIPYFRVFIICTIIDFIISFIPILAAFVMGKLTGKKKFDFKNALCLYSTSKIPVIPVYLLVAILFGANILVSVGNLLIVVAGVVTFFHFVIGYLNATNTPEDRKAYVLSAICAIVLLVFYILIRIFGGN